MFKKILLTAALIMVAIPALAQTIGGNYTATDQGGKRVTSQSYAGKYSLLYFGTTSDANDTKALKKLMGAVGQLTPEQQAMVQPIFVTVDPKTDTQAVVAQYVAGFGGKLAGLTGSEADMLAMQTAYKVYATKVPSPDGKGMTVYHSNYIYVMSKQGTFYSLLQSVYEENQLAAQLKSLIK